MGHSCMPFFPTKWILPLVIYKTKLGVCQFCVGLASEKELTALEKVQRRVPHLAMAEYSWEKSITNMLNELQWPTLKQHYFVTNQNLPWKAVNNQVVVSIPLHIKPVRSQSRGHNHTLVNISARTDNYQYSFFPKTIHCWNLLLPTIVQSDMTDQFRNVLWKEINAGHICVTEPKDSVYRPPLGRLTPHQQPILVY